MDLQDYYILIIEVRFLNFLIQVLHYNYVKNFAYKNKIKTHYSNLSKSLLNPDWGKLSKFYKNYSYPYNKFQRLIRSFIKMIYFNRHLPMYKIFINFFKYKKNISLGSFDFIKKSFIFKTNNFYKHIEWIDLVEKGLKKNIDKKALDEKVNKVITNVIEPTLFKIFSDNNIKKFSIGLSLTDITKAWVIRIRSLYEMQMGLSQLKPINQLLITECGNPFHKLIASSIKKNANVINFSHGNESGLIDKEWTNFYLFSISDYYICEKKYTTNLFKNYLKKNPYLHAKEKIKFDSIEPKQASYKTKVRALNNKSDKIMIMGFPMNVKRYTDEAYLFFHYKLRLELHLFNLLKKTDYKVSYKAHPDRLRELGKLYQGLKVQVLKDKFENIWHKADVLIFTYTSTTTFGFALSCPVPIVLIEAEGTPWIKESRVKLQKRISILSSYNEKNYKNINIETLSKAIEDAKKKY